MEYYARKFLISLTGLRSLDRIACNRCRSVTSGLTEFGYEWFLSLTQSRKAAKIFLARQSLQRGKPQRQLQGRGEPPEVPIGGSLRSDFSPHRTGSATRWLVLAALRELFISVVPQICAVGTTTGSVSLRDHSFQEPK